MVSLIMSITFHLLIALFREITLAFPSFVMKTRVHDSDLISWDSNVPNSDSLMLLCQLQTICIYIYMYYGDLNPSLNSLKCLLLRYDRVEFCCLIDILFDRWMNMVVFVEISFLETTVLFVTKFLILFLETRVLFVTKAQHQILTMQFQREYVKYVVWLTTENDD